MDAFNHARRPESRGAHSAPRDDSPAISQPPSLPADTEAPLRSETSRLEVPIQARQGLVLRVKI